MTVVFVHGLPHARCTDGPDGLRCDVCREARRRWWQKTVDERRAQLLADPSIRPHGTVTTYHSWGCRCEPCTQAATDKRYGYGYTDKKGVHHGRSIERRRPKPFGREWLAEDDQDT